MDTEREDEPVARPRSLIFFSRAELIADIEAAMAAAREDATSAIEVLAAMKRKYS